LIRWIPLFAVLLLGCPREAPPVASGAAVDDRPAWLGLDRSDLARHRRTIERKLAVLSTVDGPGAASSQRRLEAALALIRELEASGPAAGRDRERAALKSWASYFDAVLHAETTPRAATVAEDRGLIERAIEAAAAGNTEQAIELADAARGDLALAGADSLSLLIAMAEWALEADRSDVALDLLDQAAELGESTQAEIDLVDALRTEALEAELGPVAATLEEARRLVEDGLWADGAAEYQRAIDLATDDEMEAVHTAAAELTALVEASEERSADLLARVDVLLAGAGPFDSAAELLAEVEGLPEDAVDASELLRLRAWHRSLTSEDDRVQAEADRKALDDRLQQGRDLVAAGRYRDAVQAFRALEGTPLQGRAREDSRLAIDELVRQDRERAGKLFVAARKKSGADRTAALQEVRALLQGLVDEFPDSSYASRVSDNLAAVDRELEK
jgi:hypothetical protein